MERDHDKRARRPPAKKTEPEGLEKSADVKDLDLHAGQQRQELGRNPRGEPVSVNEMLARYKEVQARRFAEHGANNRQDAPDVVREDISPQQRFMEDRERPPGSRSNAADDIPLTRQTPEPQAVPQHRERLVLPFTETGAGTENTRGTARLRFDEPQETPGAAGAIAAQSDALTGSDAFSDLSAVSEQPLFRDSQPEPVSPVRGAFSHEHAPRSGQERQGQLQHNHNRLPDIPNTPQKRNTQRDSERFIASGEVKPEAAASPAVTEPLEKPPFVQDLTAPAAVSTEQLQQSNFTETANQVFTRDTGDIPSVKQTPKPQAVPPHGERLVAFSSAGADTRDKSGTAARFRFEEQPPGKAGMPHPADKTVAHADAVTNSGHTADPPATQGQPMNPSPDGSRPDRNTLSHTRPPHSKQKR